MPRRYPGLHRSYLWSDRAEECSTFLYHLFVCLFVPFCSALLHAAFKFTTCFCFLKCCETSSRSTQRLIPRQTFYFSKGKRPCTCAFTEEAARVTHNPRRCSYNMLKTCFILIRVSFRTIAPTPTPHLSSNTPKRDLHLFPPKAKSSAFSY